MRRLLPWLPGVWILVLSVGWLLSWLSFPEVVLPLGPVAVSSLVVGGLITLRTQQNLIGPVMIIGGSAALIYDLGTAYALFSTGRNVPLPAEHLAAWLGVWPLPLLYVAASMMLLLFPAGRFDGHRKVFVLAYGLETGLVGLFALRMWALPTTVLVDPEALDRLREYSLGDVVFPLGLVLILLSVVSMAYRFIRGDPILKQQIRWLLAAMLVVPLLAWVLLELFSVPEDLVLLTVPCVVPLSMGVSVIRYRLFDLDQVVARTVSYTLVVGVLGLGFFGLAPGRHGGVGGAVVRGHGDPGGGGSLQPAAQTDSGLGRPMVQSLEVQRRAGSRRVRWFTPRRSRRRGAVGGLGWGRFRNDAAGFSRRVGA